MQGSGIRTDQGSESCVCRDKQKAEIKRATPSDLPRSCRGSMTDPLLLARQNGVLELLHDARLDDRFGGNLDGLAVAGLRPMRAFRFCTTSFTIPGSTNSPDRFSSFSHSDASSSKNSRACVRFISNRSANVENSSDLPILRASAIVFPLVMPRAC